MYATVPHLISVSFHSSNNEHSVSSSLRNAEDETIPANGASTQLGDDQQAAYSADKQTTAPKNQSTVSSVLLVLTCTLALILDIASSSATTISLPRISQDFRVSEDKLQWAVSAYSLSSGCMLIFLGHLADIYGRKKAFVLGSFWMCAFSLGCGFSRNMITLDILRGVQAIGSAATVPASLGILAQSFPPSRARSIAFSMFAAGAPIGGAIGCQIGAMLTQWTPSSWRSPYFLIAGLALLTCVGGLFFIDPDKSFIENKRVDWVGAILVTSSLTLIMFVLGDGEVAPQRWRTPYIIPLLIVGILLLLAFLAWERRLENDRSGASPPPLMKLSIWTRANGKFAAIMVIGFLEWASISSWELWSQLYYQDFERLDPVQTAVRLLPMFVVGIVNTLTVAAVIGRVPIVMLLSLGTLFTGLAGLLFAVINPDAPYWAFGFPAATLSIIGSDFVFSCGTLFVAKVSAEEEQSFTGGLFQTVTQFGCTLGLALTTIVHNSMLRRAGAHSLGDRGAQLRAYQAAQWMVFAFGACGALIAAVLFHNVGIIGEREATANGSGDAEKDGYRTDENKQAP